VIRFAFAGFLAVSVFVASSSVATAQCGACMTLGRAFHQHGPLYSYANYGMPNSGCGMNGYGNCGGGHCFGNNRAPMSRGFVGGGLFSGQGLGLGNLFHGHNSCGSCGHSRGYALATLRNVFHRINPFTSRGCHPGCGSAAGCGGGCGSSACSTGCQ
jgi:hypothetical protein